MSSTQKRAILQVRIREEDKQHAERLYDAMGTSLAEAVRLFVAQSIFCLLYTSDAADEL